MTRVIWKSLYCNKNINKNNFIKTKNIWSRQSAIPAFLLNKIVFVYNGKNFKKLLITREKIGFKFGEFIFTKIRAKMKNIKKKKKN